MIFSVATISNNQTIPHGALPSSIKDPHRLLEPHRACSAQFLKSEVSSHPPALQHKMHQMHRQWVLCSPLYVFGKETSFLSGEVHLLFSSIPFYPAAALLAALKGGSNVWPLFSHTVTHLVMQFTIWASVETLVLFKWVLLITQQTGHRHQTSATRSSFFSDTREYCHGVNDLYLLKALRAVQGLQEQESVHF